MDAKITKKRLSKLFSYDWVKILAITMALIFGWIMIFELTETRIKPSQQFTVFNNWCNRPVTDEADWYLSSALNRGVFSSEVMEVEFQDLAEADLYTYEMMSSMLGASEGDVIFMPNLTNPSSVGTEEGSGNNGRYTYPESLIVPYRRYVTYLDRDKEGGYFYELEKYLNSFYTQGWTNEESIDAQAIETEFRARVKKTRDKRYRTNKNLAAGVQAEIERIEKYRDALEKLYGYIDEGLVKFNAPSHVIGDPEEMREYQGILSLNICPDESRMKNLKKYFSYPIYNYNEDGAIISVKHYTAQEMSVVFLQTEGIEDTFEYESLLYVVDLIDNAKTA